MVSEERIAQVLDERINRWRDKRLELPPDHPGQPIVVGTIQALQWTRRVLLGNYLGLRDGDNPNETDKVFEGVI